MLSHSGAGIIVAMPSLVEPHLPAGRISRSEQPSLAADDGLLLRPWSPEDAAAVIQAFQDPDIQRWNLRTAETEDEARGWITDWHGAWQEETGAHWAVTRYGTEVVGRVSMQSLLLRAGRASISYWTMPAQRRAGIAPRAVARVARWALDDIGFQRLEIEHSTANAASCRVATRAGFPWEGTRRQALLHSDGWHDMHLHARIPGDR